MRGHRIIAVANRKGGVGKQPPVKIWPMPSQKEGHMFLRSMLDPQMNLTTSYVVNGDDLPVNNINDLLPVHDDSIHSDGPGIPVGSKVLAQQRKVLLTEMGTEGFLRIILTPLKPLYDYIIIDTNWATSPLMINARTAVDGDGAHLFCFRLTFCIHPDIIKITSEYSWYTGAYPIVMGEKGSRVRIPHKAVAVLAECLSAMSLGCLFREDGEVRLNV